MRLGAHAGERARAQSLSSRPVLVAGGGIGGLATALTLHQIGVPCQVLESVREMRPLGVGINLQPNAVRELLDLGITESELGEVGVPAKEWALVGLNGNDVYAEPRGRLAGYRWSQYAVHRGRLQKLLYDKVIQRMGVHAVRFGARVTGYRLPADGGVAVQVSHADGTSTEIDGSLLIGADGIHSAVRSQMHPGQPPIHWGGSIMWRGVTWARPIRTGVFLRRARYAQAPDRLLPDFTPRPEVGAGDDQLDRRSHLGQCG